MWLHMAQILVVFPNFQIYLASKKIPIYFCLPFLQVSIRKLFGKKGKYQKTNMINWELFYLWWIAEKTGIYAEGSFQAFMLKDHFKSAKVL